MRTATRGDSVRLSARSAPRPEPEPPGRVSRRVTAPATPAGGGWLGDGRGLTAVGAVLVVLLLGGAGAGLDVATGTGLRTAFAVCFVLSCAAAAALVHHEDLLATLVMPPLLFVGLAATASMLDGGGPAGSWLTRRVLDVVTAMVTDAPVLFAAVGAAVVVVLVRFARYRSSLRRRRRAGSVPPARRPAPSA